MYYIAAQRRLAVYPRILEESGLALPQGPSHEQMIELQETMFQYLQEHPEQKKEFKRVSTVKGQSNILCLQVSRMIGELYTLEDVSTR